MLSTQDALEVKQALADRERLAVELADAAVRLGALYRQDVAIRNRLRRVFAGARVDLGPMAVPLADEPVVAALVADLRGAGCDFLKGGAFVSIEPQAPAGAHLPEEVARRTAQIRNRFQLQG